MRLARDETSHAVQDGDTGMLVRFSGGPKAVEALVLWLNYLGLGSGAPVDSIDIGSFLTRPSALTSDLSWLVALSDDAAFESRIRNWVQALPTRGDPVTTVLHVRTSGPSRINVWLDFTPLSGKVAVVTTIFWCGVSHSRFPSARTC